MNKIYSPIKTSAPGILLILVLAAISGCTSSTEPSKTRREEGLPREYVVSPGEVTSTVEAPITTLPLTEAILRSPSRGTLVEVAEVGQRVKAGDVVAKLDTEALERSIVQADLGVAEALLNLEKQKKTLESLKNTLDSTRILSQKQLVTQESLSSALSSYQKEELQYQSLELALKRARLAWEEARENRLEAWIKSPVDGVVSSVGEEAGTYVDANAELLRVVDISVIILSGQVDEYDIGKIKVGLEALATFEALEGKSFPSVIKTVSPMAKTENNVPVYTVTARVNNPGELIRPGMGGDLNITVSRETGLVVPKSSVIQENGRTFLQVIRKSVPEAVEVTLGPGDGKNVIVRSGLIEGDRLAVVPDAASGTSGPRSPEIPRSNSGSRSPGMMGFGSGPGAGGPPPGGF